MVNNTKQMQEDGEDCVILTKGDRNEIEMACVTLALVSGIALSYMEGREFTDEERKTNRFLITAAKGGVESMVKRFNIDLDNCTAYFAAAVTEAILEREKKSDD